MQKALIILLVGLFAAGIWFHYGKPPKKLTSQEQFEKKKTLRASLIGLYEYKNERGDTFILELLRAQPEGPMARLSALKWPNVGGPSYARKEPPSKYRGQAFSRGMNFSSDRTILSYYQVSTWPSRGGLSIMYEQPDRLEDGGQWRGGYKGWFFMINHDKSITAIGRKDVDGTRTGIPKENRFTYIKIK